MNVRGGARSAPSLADFLTSCGIENHAGKNEDTRCFTCPKCGVGAAEAVDYGDGKVRLYCPRCCPETGESLTFDDFRQPFAKATAARLEAWALPDFLARTDLAIPGQVVEGLLLAGTVNFLYGPAGTGKSFMGADMARCKAAGRPFLERFTCEPGAVVLVEEESAPALLRQRLADLEAGEPLPAAAATLTILPLQGLRLDDEGYIHAVRELLRGLAAQLVVVDTLAAVAGGTDLLELRQVRPLMAFFREIASELGAAVLILAHSPKWVGKAPTLAALYGSEDLGAACDSAFAICELPTKAFRVAQTKHRWGADKDKADFTFTIGPGPEGSGLVLLGGDSEKDGVDAVLLDALDDDEWVSVRELMEAVEAAGYTADGGRKALRRLRAEGEVEAQGATNRREYRRSQDARGA